MKFPEFLRLDCDGEIHLSGHRIGLFHLVHFYNEGESAEMLACRYPTLPLPLVHKVIAFYLENHTEVDAYVADCRARLQQLRDADPRRLDAENLRKRLEARQRTRSAVAVAIPSGIRLSQEAFWRDLPELLRTEKNHGKWVCYHGDERIGIASTPEALIRECQRRVLTRDQYDLDVIEPRSLPPWEPEEVAPLGPWHFEDLPREA